MKAGLVKYVSSEATAAQISEFLRRTTALPANREIRCAMPKSVISHGARYSVDRITLLQRICILGKDGPSHVLVGDARWIRTSSSVSRRDQHSFLSQVY